MEHYQKIARERILQAATHLFAELGYDQTDSQMIADAAGVPVSAVNKEFGDRRNLYLTVLKAVEDREEEMLKEITSKYTYDRRGARYLIDHAFDFFLENPQAVALWMQRTMYDAADFKEIEKLHSFPQIDAGRSLVENVFREDLDTELALWTLLWSIRSFVRGGIPDEHGHRVGREDPRSVERFRRHLHKMVDLFTKDAGPAA